MEMVRSHILFVLQWLHLWILSYVALSALSILCRFWNDSSPSTEITRAILALALTAYILSMLCITITLDSLDK